MRPMPKTPKAITSGIHTALHGRDPVMAQVTRIHTGPAGATVFINNAFTADDYRAALDTLPWAVDIAVGYGGSALVISQGVAKQQAA